MWKVHACLDEVIRAGRVRKGFTQRAQRFRLQVLCIYAALFIGISILVLDPLQNISKCYWVARYVAKSLFSNSFFYKQIAPMGHFYIVK